MFQNIKIRTKLLISFMYVSIIPFLIYGAVSLHYSSEALSEQAFAKLEAVRDLKKAQLKIFFNERQGDMAILRETVATLRQAAFEKLKIVQELKIAQIESYFQRCVNDITVLSENATVGAALETYASLPDADGSIDESVYDSYERIRFGDSFKQFRKTYGYDDLMLVTREGTLVYSLSRETNLGKNLLTEPLKGTLLSHTFQKGLKKIAISDFAPYPPSGNKPICFIAAPVSLFDKIEGVLMLKINTKTINQIVQRRQGMGATGETYLIGRFNDQISLRSDRIIKTGQFGESKTGEDIEKALSGQSGSIVKLGSTGDMEIVRYDPLEIADLDWAMITTKSLEEIIAPKLIGEDEDYFAKFVKRYNYDNLLLIHPLGDIFYSTAQGSEYRSNVTFGEYSGSVLGWLVREVMLTRQFGFSDIESYSTDDGRPAIFMAQPVVFYDRVELVAVLRISVDAINVVMKERSGMGQTGETYLVGNDGRMRSDSFRDPEHYSVKASYADPERGSINTDASRQALSGKTGRQQITTYTGRNVFSAYTPLEVGDLTWALIAETDVGEALTGLKRLKILMAQTTGIAIIAIIIVAFMVTRRVIRPVNRVVGRIKTIAKGKGDLTSRLTVRGDDEMGNLAKWFNIFVENVQEIIKKIAENAQTLTDKSPVFLKLSNQMASDADRMSSISDSVAAATEEMSSNVNTIAAAAEEMSFNINNISSTSEQMSQSMNTVAGAIEEMSASINEVASNSRQSGTVTNQATAMADTATQVMQGLGEAAQGIDDVTQIITQIAEQTNMLALNATIQAASAGKAGKGFSVIAKEIKELAVQSAQSSADISRRIETVQAETLNAVTIIDNISKIIKEINRATYVVKDAVKQQADTVDEISVNARQTERGSSAITMAIAEVVQSADDMSENAGEAAKASTKIAFSINTVKQAADKSSSGSMQVDRLGKDMIAVTQQLQKIVNKFKIT
ncbi:methyl-accepting chemotaxis protein [Desulfococcaceae bacterium HSG7]|nr:methyl-accepting chemotaxis protein [Desulfococcaceae bacterium HSG7]